MHLKRLLVHTLFLCPLSAFATTAVTGHIVKLDTTTPGTSSYVRFWLRGTRGNQPRITGTGAIAPQFSGSAFYVDLPADANGNVSGTIYSTRNSAGTGAGDIEAGGSYTAVYYGMQIVNGGIAGPEIPIHAKSGGSIDIANVTPVSTLPVVTSPTGDTTYARIDGGNTPFTGSVTFGANTTVNNLDNIIFVDGVKYANIAAAVTAAGSNLTLIIIPSSYAGTECPASAVSTITFWDLRGGANICSQNVISYNTTSGGGLVSFLRGIHIASSVTSGGNVSGYFQNILNNATCVGGCTTDGGSFELDLQGTFAGTMTVAQAAEQAVSVTTTGGAITQLNGVIGYLNTGTGSTTAITTFNGIYGAGCKSILGTPPVNCYGLYGEQQFAGSSRNYALGFNGPALALFGSNANYSGIDAEDASHVTHQWLLIDNGNNTVMKAVNAAGIQLQSSDGIAQQTITSTGVAIRQLFTKYNNISTVGNGVPAEYGTVDLTAQGANIGSATLYAVPASGSNFYRISCYVVLTTVATTSATLPSCVIGWTDKDNSTVQSLTLTPTNSTNALTNFQENSAPLSVKSSTNITYSTTGYATSGATSMQYAIHIRLEAM